MTEIAQPTLEVPRLVSIQLANTVQRQMDDLKAAYGVDFNITLHTLLHTDTGEADGAEAVQSLYPCYTMKDKPGQLWITHPKSGLTKVTIVGTGDNQRAVVPWVNETGEYPLATQLTAEQNTHNLQTQTAKGTAANGLIQHTQAGRDMPVYPVTIASKWYDKFPTDEIALQKLADALVRTQKEPQYIDVAALMAQQQAEKKAIQEAAQAALQPTAETKRAIALNVIETQLFNRTLELRTQLQLDTLIQTEMSILRTQKTETTPIQRLYPVYQERSLTLGDGNTARMFMMINGEQQFVTITGDEAKTIQHEDASLEVLQGIELQFNPETQMFEGTAIDKGSHKNGVIETRKFNFLEDLTQHIKLEHLHPLQQLLDESGALASDPPPKSP